MALNIRNPEAERLAAAVAKITGETKTQAVIGALRARLRTLRQQTRRRSLADDLDEIAQHCASLPVLDGRSPDDILGYDDSGIVR